MFTKVVLMTCYKYKNRKVKMPSSNPFFYASNKQKTKYREVAVPFPSLFFLNKSRPSHCARPSKTAFCWRVGDGPVWSLGTGAVGGRYPRMETGQGLRPKHRVCRVASEFKRGGGGRCPRVGVKQDMLAGARSGLWCQPEEGEHPCKRTG